MGCSGSTLTASAAGEAVPEKIRPLLRRRLEEFKKRSHAKVLKGSKTPSKKELLKHGNAASDDDEETLANDVIGNSVRSATVVPVSPKEKKKETLSDKKNDEGKDEEGENEKEREKLKVVTEKEEDRVENVKNENEGKDNEELENDDKEKEEGGENEEDGGRLSSFDGSMICPGSPSFRIYCVDVSDTDNEDEKANKEHKTGNGIDNNAKSNKKSTTTTAKTENKKGKRMTRFRRVLPKRPSGKNLFGSAKFSYIPGCMSHHHHHHAHRNSV